MTIADGHQRAQRRAWLNSAFADAEGCAVFTVRGFGRFGLTPRTYVAKGASRAQIERYDAARMRQRAARRRSS